MVKILLLVVIAALVLSALGVPIPGFVPHHYTLSDLSSFAPIASSTWSWLSSMTPALVAHVPFQEIIPNGFSSIKL